LLYFRCFFPQKGTWQRFFAVPFFSVWRTR
jgi:hypothetical protein